jgi:hypothetical protein
MTVYFQGTVLLPIEQQSDKAPFDPDNLHFDPTVEYPVLVNFNSAAAPVGLGHFERTEDGSLIAKGMLGPLFPFDPSKQHPPYWFTFGARQVKGDVFEALEISIVPQSIDPQPPVEFASVPFEDVDI